VQAKSVERARRSLQGALALIDELLVLARAESGVMLVVRRSTDVHALVNDVVDEYRSQIDARGLAVEVALARAPHVLTDAAKVRQILGNLVSNAVKYTERGRIRIAVGEGFSAPSGAYCRGVFIEVSDTGLGVPSDQQELLFGEFVRLHPTAAPGAGIGLAISRRVADAIGGDVRLTLSNASGSTFTLWLPLDEPFTPRRSAARTEITESGQANAPRLRGAFG
jgi:signal transduction histidine kinase